MSKAVDTLIIGSGFGGSITAQRLTQAGQKVLLLERGPWRDSLPVRSMGIAERSPYPYGWRMLTHLLRSVQGRRSDWILNKAGLLDISVFKGLLVAVASGVGGGSTTWGGLLQVPRNPNYWNGHHPELDPASIESHYGGVIAEMDAEPLCREHHLPESVWTHFPAGPGRAVSVPDAQPHMAMRLPRSPDDVGRIVTDAYGVQRRYAAFNGDSFLGSRDGAKGSVDFIYLAPALRNGLQVRDLCQVTRIQPARPVDGGGYWVSVTDLRNKTCERIRAGRVVLAAGNLNTQRLLFASMAGAGNAEGIAPMTALGQRFGANGDLMAIWHKSAGKAQGSSLYSAASHGAFHVNNCPDVDFGVGGLPGLDQLPLPGFIKRRIGRSYFMYGIGGDSDRGSVSYNSGRLQAHYDEQTEPVYARMRRALEMLASETTSHVQIIHPPITVHPWGGACVGANAKSGVINHRGEIYGNPGLYVADGSALPAAPAAPPSLAIAAWAHHVADGLIQQPASVR